MSEDQRLAVLEAYRLAAPTREPNLDRITALAARLFDTPMAAVTLIAASRQWLTNRIGIDDPSTPRDEAFCDHAIRLPKGSVMVVEDATRDARFVNNPNVTPQDGIRFYVGAVLTSRDGHNLGSLCVIDRRARPRPTEAELETLRNLAELVVDQLEGAQADRRLAEQSRLLGMAEAISHIGHWRRDLRANRLEWSDEMFRIHGVNRANFNPDSDDPLALYDPADLPELARVRQSLKEQPGVVEAQVRLRRPDGELRHVQLRATSERAPDGEAIAQFGVMQDVTDQRRAMHQLSRSEQRHRLLADNMADVVTRIRLDGSSNYISPAVERLLGYSPSEMAGKPAQAFVHEPDVPILLNAFATMAQGQDEITVQLRAAHRTGAPVPVEASLRLVRDEAGSPREMVAVIRDISERVRLQAQLEASEARASRIVDAAHQAIVTIDEKGLVIGWNPHAEATFGWTAAEAIGVDIAELIIPPEQRGGHLGGLARFLATGEARVLDRRIEVMAQRKDGERFPIELAASAVQGADGWQFTALMHDITARTEAQAALARRTEELASMTAELGKARDAADAANRAKSEFLANMSHELRTPLNGVIGFSRLLADSPTLTPDDRRRVMQVRSAGEALNALINDVLDFSKLEARAVQLETKPFNLGDLVSEALSMVEPQAREKRVKLFVTGDDAGVLVGDPFRLRQVLLNLLSNAVKFTQDGAVSVEVAVAGETAAGVALRVSVTDEGVGIPADRLSVLFNRFSQADGSVSRTFGGTGLGLAISRELVELMGGRIGVESEFGRGSTFWLDLTLPRGDAAERPRRGAKRGKAAFPGRRILVVDDVALNRELTEEMLAQHECVCDLASDGEQALAAAARQSYDLILMDVHMPVMDGLTATRAMRAQGQQAPIVALTASGSPEQVAACYDAGMDGHLLKPISAQELEQALARHLTPAAKQPQREAAPSPDADAQARQSLEQMGASTALRMVGMFQALLDELPEIADTESLIAKAHRIAGSAAMVGQQRLGLVARELEDRCRDGQPHEEALALFHSEANAASRSLAAWARDLQARTAEAQV